MSEDYRKMWEVAKNPCMRRLMEESLQTEILVPESPQMVGALGAALLACEIP